MARMLTHARHQYAAGQGCFHAAGVGSKGSKNLDPSGVIYVYDCGALSPYRANLTDAIDRFHSEIGHGHIDFLFISHLHLDHVSGIEQLCGPGNGSVDTVVLPLLSDIDRLISFARAAAEDAAGITDFFVQMIANPAIALVEHLRPRQIIFVQRGEGDAPSGDEPLEPRGPSPQDIGSSSRKKSGTRWRLVGQGRSRSGTDIQAGRVGETEIHTVDDTIGIEISNELSFQRWLLAPYVDEVVVERRAEFIAEAAQQLKITTCELEQRARNPQQLLDLVLHHKAELIRAYESVASLNVTSLSLLSVPADARKAGQWRVLHSPPAWRFYSFLPRSRRVGWLGTGDAALKQLTRCRSFLNHYSARLHQVSTFLLPHHGSAHNFRSELLDAIDPALCLAAAAPYSNWKHPGAAVIQAANSRGCPLWTVTGDRRSEVQENVWVSP